MLKTDVAWSQIIGKREKQQDNACIVSWPNGFKLLLLADGMGGHAAGEIASTIVVDSFKKHFIESKEQNIQERLIQALEAVNILIYKAVKENPELSGMGTTLIAAVFDGQELQWLSVGDSPMWLYGKDKTLKRLNENHSMSEVLAKRVEDGEITKAEADNSPQRSQLLEAVMGENIKLVDAPNTSISLEEGDYLVLASDGVETLNTHEIEHLISSNGNKADELCLSILNEVNNKEIPTQDNSTILVLHCVATDDANHDPISLEQEKAIEEPKTVQ